MMRDPHVDKNKLSKLELERRGLERRQITIMFADIVGSTSMARALDPEDLATLTLRFQRDVEDRVHHFDGHVARVIGDGVLVYFGWPNAHEDDPERAVRAAEEIHARLGNVNDIKCKISIATGPVVVGDASADGVSQRSAVFGETPNLAARLQDLASPGTTVVSELTYQLIKERFACRQIAQADLKGFDAPENLYEVEGENAEGTGAEADRFAKRGQQFGRASELAELMRCWEQVGTGCGTSVRIVGEAGIGKTHLLGTHRSKINCDPNAIVVYQCSRLHSNTAFYPMLQQLKRWVGIKASDGIEERVELVRTRLSPSMTSLQVNLILRMLEPQYKTGQAEAQISELRFREEIQNAFVQLTRHLAQSSPFLMHFEDVHWIDPSSAGVIDALLKVLPDIKCLCVMSSRPGYEISEKIGACDQVIELAALDTATATEMVTSKLLHSEEHGSQLIPEILKRSSGIPLYIDALTAAVRDRQSQSDVKAVNLKTIPASLQDLLMERLDMLDQDRLTALNAAVLGRPFDIGLVQHLLGADQQTAKLSVEALLQKSILRKVAGSEPPEYEFTHVLLREAAYGSLVRVKRQELHRHVADALDSQDPEFTRWEPEFRAYHHHAAENYAKALPLWITASQRALHRFGYEEALSSVENGFDTIKNLSGEDATFGQMQLHWYKGSILRAQRGFGSTQAMESLNACFELAKSLDNRKFVFRTARALSVGHHIRAEYDEAMTFARVIEDMAGEDVLQSALAGILLAAPLIWKGEFNAAESELARISDLIQGYLGSHSGADLMEVQAKALGAMILAFKGQQDAAIASAGDAVALAQAVGHPLEIANAMVLQCNVHQILMDPDNKVHASKLRALAREHRLPFYETSAASFLAVAMYAHGDVETGYLQLKQASKAYSDTTSRINQLVVAREMARGCLLLGRLDEGLEAVEFGLKAARENGEGHFLAEIYRLKGVLLSELGGDPDEAASACTQAVEIAEKQNAWFFRDLAQAGVN